MDLHVLFSTLERVLDESHTGVLATVDKKGQPHTRWMVACVLRGRPGFLYAVTSPRFAKIAHLDIQPRVSWLFQTERQAEVLEVEGDMQAIDNPSLKVDVLESLGTALSTFWRVNPDETDLLVLETTIESITHLKPARGEITFASSKEK